MSKHKESDYEIVFTRLVGKYKPTYPQAIVKLTGCPMSEGNAYVVLGKFEKALKLVQIDQVSINLIMEEAMSGDYGYLLKTVAKNATVI